MCSQETSAGGLGVEGRGSLKYIWWKSMVEGSKQGKLPSRSWG